MGAKLMFSGAAKASTNSPFVDQCIGLLNEAWWREGAPTVNIVPQGLSIRATFAWRGETFASGFPGTETEIRLSPGKEEDAVPYPCTGSCAKAIQKLALLLNKYLEKQTEARAQWTERAGKDREVLKDLIAETAVKS